MNDHEILEFFDHSYSFSRENSKRQFEERDILYIVSPNSGGVAGEESNGMIRYSRTMYRVPNRYFQGSAIW